MTQVTVQTPRPSGEWVPMFVFTVTDPADAQALGKCVSDLTAAGVTFRLV